MRGIAMKDKPILCLAFDGVIHSYVSGWRRAAVIPDPPVTGALEFIASASEHFKIAIFSTRSNQRGGIRAMKKWLRWHMMHFWGAHPVYADDIFSEIQWPKAK